MPICAVCGQDNPDGFRFCGACAAELAVEAAPREVRKTVTVLFADVTGSTALGERLDPESLRRVMARYFDVARSSLERHGGTVEKFIGDAVMAVFGVPAVHEDDALRALRAAVELRGALASLNEELERDYGVSLQVRVGVNTGEVVTGTDERLATGDAVNVAARLEQAASPGEIQIGERTLRLARDAVEVEPVDRLELKGKTEPVAAYRLVAVFEGAPAFVRRLDSPMVGRTRELAALRQAFERAVSEPSCHLFTVLGPAGVGKSRLVAELLAGIGSDTDVLSGRCLSYGEGITYWPLVEVFREAGDDELADALSRPTPEETAWGVRTALERRARERPLVVVLDDLHWAEPTFLDLVEHVSDLSRDAPILLLCLARPELLDVRPFWGGGKLNATAVLLEPLPAEESEQLVVNLAGRLPLDEGVRKRILEAAEGNPLFVEEMLAMVAEENGRSADIDVPPTIQALVSARIDRLGHDERTVLECASVEGKVFHRGAVAELAPEALRPQVAAQLTGLVRKELVRPERTDFTGEDAFRFRNLLIRDTAYESLPKETRAELHERFATWLEARAGDAPEFDEILGYHLEQAFRYREQLGPVGERERAVAARAAERLGSAGLRAYARSDAPAAMSLLSRAVELLPRAERRRVELLPELAGAMLQGGDVARSAKLAADAVDEAVELGDLRLEWYGRMAEVDVRAFNDRDINFELTTSMAEAALPIFEELGDDRGLARAWFLLSYEDWAACRNRARTEKLERVREHARRAGDRALAARAVVWLGVSLWFGPAAPDVARPQLQELVREFDGDRGVEAVLLRFLAGFHAMEGDFDEARRLCEQGRVILEDVGLRLWLGGQAHVTSEVEVLAGDLVEAERQLREGYEILEAIGESSTNSTTAGLLARVLYRQGRLDEALQWAESAEQLCSSDDVLSLALSRQVRGMVLASRGSVEEGEALARDAAARLCDGTDTLNLQGDALSDLAEVLRIAGRADEARGALEQAIDCYERKGNAVMVERIRTSAPPATA